MAQDGNPYTAFGHHDSGNPAAGANHRPAAPRKPGFWRSFGRALRGLRAITANLLFVLFLLLLLSLVMRGCQETLLPPKGALLINPKGAIVEQPNIGNPLEGLLNPAMTVAETAVGDIVRAIDHAADDERINMVVLRLDELSWLSITHAQTLGTALQRFQARDKEVVAYGFYYDQGPYLLASFADAVYMHPMGQTILTGFERFGLYFKDLIDRLKINLHVFRVGDYKSFVEPYQRNSMSDEAREANEATLSALWDVFTATVARNRQLEPATLGQYLNAFPEAVAATSGDLARAALEANLVDELLSEDEIRARIAQSTGRDEQGEFVATDFRTYLQAIDAEPDPSGPYVTLVTLDGAIVMSDNGSGGIAADATVRLLRSIANDSDAAALVVRVDSPGGSSFASELIRKELELIQQSGKPVVISMASTAASGGYWIAATADAIIAEPTTITGSIGIFSLVPTFEASLESIGVHSDGVGTTPLSGTFSPMRGIGEPMQRVLQGTLENGYAQFINLVAKGRDMTPAAVQAVAQGRIWTGQQALDLGLVDAVGGVNDATQRAAELAGLNAVEVKPIRPQPSARDQLLAQLLGAAQATGFDLGVSAALGDSSGGTAARLRHWQRHATALLRIQDPNYRYVWCDACVSLSRPMVDR